MDLFEQLRTARLPGSAHRIDPYRIGEQGRRLQRRRRSLVAMVAVVAGVATVIGIVQLGAVSRPSTPSTSGSVDPILTLNGMPPLACELANLSVLSAPGGAENAKTPEAAALRHVFAHDPTGGESPQTPHGWVLLARDRDHVTFGQRHGRIGIGATVTVQRKSAGYVWSGSGGCGPIGWADGQSALPLATFDDNGSSLNLIYNGGSCDTRPATLKVHETATKIDVLLINPKPQPPTPGNIGCLGVGMRETIRASLTTPRHGRPVLDASQYPARTLLSTAQARAAAAVQNRNDVETQSLCDAEAQARRLSEASSWTTDVITVRTDIPAARTLWARLPGNQLAGYCYLGSTPKNTITVAVAVGAPAIVHDPHYTKLIQSNLPPPPGHTPPP